MRTPRNLYIIIGALISIIVGGIFYGWGRNSFFDLRSDYMMEGSHMEEEMHEKVNYDKPVAETHKDTYDFGKVKQVDGIVSTTFEIENHGKKTLEVGTITTSCGCTSAEIEKVNLSFNEETDLTVFFDPNFHKEPESVFTRSVFVETNDPDLPEMQFDIHVEIVE